MIYLDNAATTYPKPLEVRQAVESYFRHFGANPGRSGYNMSIETSKKIFECREMIRKMFNAENAENIIFTQNCTHSLNIALKGLVKKGDHVIVSNFEHNAVMRPVYELKEKRIIDFDIAEVDVNDDEITVKNFKKLIRGNTSLIVCTHASNVFGFMLPITKIGKLASEYNIKFMVDAAQSAGIIDIDMKKSNITALCIPGHKGLYGPTGTGILIWNNVETEHLNTIIEGGTGSLSSDLKQPDFLPDRFESGTINTMGIIGLSEGIKFVNRVGIKKMYHAEKRLISMYWNDLKKNKNIILYTDNPEEINMLPVLSFNIIQKDSEEVAMLLNNYNVAVRGGYHCAIKAHETMKTLDSGTVRISLSAFSSEKDEKNFMNIINKIAK